MEDTFLRCPQCGVAAFYIEPDGSMVFLKVNAEGKPVFDNPDLDPSGIDVSVIYCTACAWHGPISDLK